MASGGMIAFGIILLVIGFGIVGSVQQQRQAFVNSTYGLGNLVPQSPTETTSQNMGYGAMVFGAVIFLMGLVSSEGNKTKTIVKEKIIEKPVEAASRPPSTGTSNFCHQCGTNLKEGAKFCGACGTKV